MKKDLVDRAIEIIKTASDMSHKYYHKPLLVTYSGGKDSDVLADLAVKSGADVEFSTNHTTVDAPETVYHIRDVFKRLEEKGYKTTVTHAKDKDGNIITMWSLIEHFKIPPTRQIRYCCYRLKENGTGNDRIIATGIRGAESKKRRDRQEFEIYAEKAKDRRGVPLEKMEAELSSGNEDEIYDCIIIQHAKKNKKLVANPIFSWSDDDVWEYIHENHIQYNPLYDRGWKRVGCIGCPLASQNNRIREFNEFPKYRQMYVNAFQRMIDIRKAEGLKVNKYWETGEDVMSWYLQLPESKGQMKLDL